MKPPKRIIALAVWGVLFAGCSEDVVVKRMKPGLPDVGEAKVAEDISAELAAFTPPFPLHAELFEPQRRAKSGVMPVMTSGEQPAVQEPEIELLGFGTVDAQHALLMIDGRLEALRVGEHFGNVRVLKITPPLVQLRVADRVREARLSAEHEG